MYKKYLTYMHSFRKFCRGHAWIWISSGCVACFMAFQQEVPKLLCDHSAYWYKKISRLLVKKSNKLLNFPTAAGQIARGNRRKRASWFFFAKLNLFFFSMYPRLFSGKTTYSNEYVCDTCLFTSAPHLYSDHFLPRTITLLRLPSDALFFLVFDRSIQSI